MAEIADGGGGDAKGGKKRAKKSSTRVDMTPMVDLAFLLLTFFVLTSTFSKPKIMSLVYPAKINEEDIQDDKDKINNGVTFLLSKDRVFYYKGEFLTKPKDGFPATTLTEIDFGPGKTGIRQFLADNNSFVIRKHKELDLQFQQGKIADSIVEKGLNEAKRNKQALKVLVKTDLKATCKNFIDMIDELVIADIGVIAPVDLMKDEQVLIDAKIK